MQKKCKKNFFLKKKFFFKIFQKILPDQNHLRNTFLTNVFPKFLIFYLFPLFLIYLGNWKLRLGTFSREAPHIMLQFKTKTE